MNPEDGSIDAGLDVLLSVTVPGQTWSQADIAEVCGCTRNTIWYYEQTALKKLKVQFEQRLAA